MPRNRRSQSVPNGKPRRKTASIRRNRGGAVRTFVLPYEGPALSVFGATDTLPGGSLSFEYRLADLTQAAQYTALYDMYKINWVEVDFCPGANYSAVINATEPPGGTNPAYNVPSLHTAEDFGITTFPSSASALMGYESYKRSYLDRPCTRRFILRGTVPMSNTGTLTPDIGVMQPLSDEAWFSTQYPLLRFGSLLVFVDPVSTASVALTPMQIRTWCRMSVSFKNVV